MFTTADVDGAEVGGLGGQVESVQIVAGRIEGSLVGPPDGKGGNETAGFAVHLDPGKSHAWLRVGGEKVRLELGKYSPWVVVPFARCQGIARFLIQTWDSHEFRLYVTPIQVDPAKPALPISHPPVYSVYLAKTIGRFATLGLAEDTWALNEGHISEEDFLAQAWLNFEERKAQLFDACEKTKEGLVTCVFDTSDRVSHMFYRYLVPGHPANRGRDSERNSGVIEDMYRRMDGLVGELQEKLAADPDTVLMVISDHGFCNFSRGVNLNTWLMQEGYLVLEEGATESGDWFERVDWGRTKAFTLGLTGIFLNRKGREQFGVVEEGAESAALAGEIRSKLLELRDPASGEKVMNSVALTGEVHSGPYADAAPEILMGYRRGYRHSWACATGAVEAEVFSDNTKRWSGDHCVDPSLVPGVFWCNRDIQGARPNLVDMAPTALALFGLKIPGYMQGKNLFEPAAERSTQGAEA